uniref:Formylglycine-generating enzyme, required for sulfatase activity, contains SUMF1/FGE domain n=1 Tax=Candidatus Kentrum eta TaxID=2126337 RepID=A0A450V5K9_9GAMM|nr:MAG: Formylglycine-generating enzyme, required for sulfatase activity, contains SUMF1/FGE domain [Candidatus Kentron sp. H]VFK00328.1 MAG: Formylglycine-generating enzyme, required for sulfatase activity, contains SUMF1/FGE domain [Candidatus Kentron sp. H]VFK04546.1 MAG: Formylglycine-generating enzyme, required for sulfatase activity, contains SUMF1/FGE domain [Candidatus Kentron sp. H]
MLEFTAFLSSDWLGPLADKLANVRRGGRAEEVTRISDIFGDPKRLARDYIEPNCQQNNPTDHFENRYPIAYVRTPVFTTLGVFFTGDPAPPRDGRTRMFLLADAGMGKTSLLVMVKLTHLMAFWPKGYDCQLLKIGPDTLDIVEAHPDKANTVLLLDALDEDTLAWRNAEARILGILKATENYRRVVISCRTWFFPGNPASGPFANAGRVQLGPYVCPTVFLSLFDDAQVMAYLRRRFPNRLYHTLFRRENPRRAQAGQIVDALRAPCLRPLLLAHMDDILEDGDHHPKHDWRAYDFYRTLVGAWLSRESRRLHKRYRSSPKPPDEEELWSVCTVIAAHTQRQSDGLLSRTALDQLMTTFPEIANLRHFEVGGRSLLQGNADGGFRFSHDSIREFLITHCLVTDGKARLEEKGVRVTDRILELLKEIFEFDIVRTDERVNRNRTGGLSDLHFCDRLSDNSPGPPMQMIPVGEFLMGSPEREGDLDEHPQHPVRIDAPFALGTWPVTFAEYDRFCAATHRWRSGDRGWGREQRPAINVSWQDARDYCAWLSRETGRYYRLPSEAEWEYAARAGTGTDYWWGDNIGANRANCDGCGSEWDRRQTAPVGAFAPNPFGLYDMAGNVWEWVADCWHDNYRGAPDSGLAWEKANGGDCSKRAVRGGGWIFKPRRLRSANRGGVPFDKRVDYIGFRLARVIDSNDGGKYQ